MMKVARVLCCVLVVALGVGLCVGCEAFKPKPPEPPPTTETKPEIPDMEGKWRLSWENDAGAPKVDLTLDLDQDGEELEGSSSVASLALKVEGEVESDGEVEFKAEMVINPAVSWTFEGELDSKTKMSGTWTDTGASPLAPPDDKGEWNAIKID